jgi:spore germination cell wall hydrolase CwlJ-like protein|tara:strand:+ start:212 stop:685 length:474 start_codon:yes stop_codon:yes gene_type:complete
MRLLTTTLVTLFLLISAAKADEFNCLVEALYHEARSESFIGMISVANVVLTRKESSNFPNTICKVVHQGKYWKGNPIKDKCQFSYWCDGKPERFIDIEGLIKSLNVAEMSLNGIQSKQTVGATHYHASYVTPGWASDPNFKSLGQIGTHVFYIDMRE